MRYPVTSRTKSLVAELASLAEAADGRLARASADAQREWKALRYRWPTEDELGKGIVELSDDDLAVMRSKVMRFVSILGAAGPARSPIAEIPRLDLQGVPSRRLNLGLVSSAGHQRRP